VRYRRTPAWRWGGAECDLCSTPITFVINEATGRRIPVNVLPDGAGNVAAMKIGNNLHGYVLSKARPVIAPGYRSYMPHAATCPDRPRPKPAPKRPESQQLGLFDPPDNHHRTENDT
jgi:hypothetical protein